MRNIEVAIRYSRNHGSVEICEEILDKFLKKRDTYLHLQFRIASVSYDADVYNN